MKNSKSDLNYSAKKESVLNCGIFQLPPDFETAYNEWKDQPGNEKGTKPQFKKLWDKMELSINLYALHPSKPLIKLSETSTIPEVKVTFMVWELAEVLYKFNEEPEQYTIDNYLKEIKTDMCKVLEDHYFPINEAEEHIDKILKNKDFKQKLIDTGAYDKMAKNHNKYINLYVPLFHIFLKHLNHYFGKKPQNQIYFYMSHFLVGCDIEKPTVEQAYARIKKTIERFEKIDGGIPAYKRFREKSLHLINPNPRTSNSKAF